MGHKTAIRIAVLYPTDPAGLVIGGIDSFIRGLIKNAPEHIEYSVIGATIDPVSRPVRRWTEAKCGEKWFRYFPLISLGDEAGKQPWIPATLRYEGAALLGMPDLNDYTVLESHRIEHLLFRRADVPVNLYLHQNMAVLKDKRSDIRWRHLPEAYYWLERQVLKKTNSIFCVREDAVQNYRETYPSFADRFQFVSTWMDPEIFYPADPAQRKSGRRALCQRFGIPDERNLLVAVGRLDHQKDPLLMIKALAIVVEQHPHTHLIWVGDGVLRNEAIRAAKQANIAGHLTLTGLLKPE